MSHVSDAFSTCLLSGRLVRERIAPAMLSAVQSQMGASDASYEDLSSLTSRQEAQKD